MGFCVQSFRKVWRELSSKSLFTDFSKAMAPYMLSDNCSCQFQVLATRSRRLSLQLQQKILVDAGRPHECEEGVDTTALDCLVSTYDALRYVTFLMFDGLHSLI